MQMKKTICYFLALLALPLAAGTFELDTPVWGKADPACKTTLELRSENGNLLVKAVCAFPPGTVLKSEQRQRGEPVWEDESFEIFLSPVVFGSSPVRYSFAVNASGAMSETKDLDRSVRLPWSCKVNTEKDRWTLSASIPLKKLNGTGLWRVNACRNSYNAAQDYVLGLAMAAPGYNSPSLPLVTGPVKAEAMAKIINEALSVYSSSLAEWLPSADRRIYHILVKAEREFAATPDAMLSKSQAEKLFNMAAMLRKSAETGGKTAALLNFMFNDKH